MIKVEWGKFLVTIFFSITQDFFFYQWLMELYKSNFDNRFEFNGRHYFLIFKISFGILFNIVLKMNKLLWCIINLSSIGVLLLHIWKSETINQK